MINSLWLDRLVINTNINLLMFLAFNLCLDPNIISLNLATFKLNLLALGYLTCEILFLPRENIIHIFSPMCNILYLQNPFNTTIPLNIQPRPDVCDVVIFAKATVTK